MARTLSLGRWTAFDRPGPPQPLGVPPHHLVTHAAIVGTTGSGKTGLVFVLVEEALRNGVPVLVVDLKGDLTNLLLSFPVGAPNAFLPWIDADAPHHEGRSPAEIADGLSAERDAGLAKAGIAADQVIMKSIALGWPDYDFPANAVVSERKSVAEAAVFVGFRDDAPS